MANFLLSRERSADVQRRLIRTVSVDEPSPDVPISRICSKPSPGRRIEQQKQHAGGNLRDNEPATKPKTAAGAIAKQNAASGRPSDAHGHDQPNTCRTSTNRSIPCTVNPTHIASAAPVTPRPESAGSRQRSASRR